MKPLSNYHKLSELLNFDLFLVANVINTFYDLDDVEKIFSNLENLKLENYNEAMIKCLELDEDELKLLALNYGFKSENSYIGYLTSLLDLNSIFYLDYRQKEQKHTSKYTTGSLF